MFFSRITGYGHAFPSKIFSNDDLSKILDTNDEWISSRTGIKTRYIAAENESSSSLGAKAAIDALSIVGESAKNVDAIILATTTPDHSMPATAAKIQSILGANTAFAFDVQAVCSGFIYALSIADHFLKCGTIKNALVIGAEVMSRIVDWTDRSTCVLFGDGAGAIFLQRYENNRSFEESPESQFLEGTNRTQERNVLNVHENLKLDSIELCKRPNNKENSKIISTHLFSDGNFYDTLYVDERVKTEAGKGAIKMNGRVVFSSAIEHMVNSAFIALEKNNLTVEDLDWFVAH
ncbi:MAG: beta-ketoacyl-ACP synthase 3, partial [Holosporales bacterium]|nr:beta-ketoacyl-ACP synthase 3 [Holosporales bacterium]